MVVWKIAKGILLFEILGNYYLCLYHFHVIKLNISGKESMDGKREINQRSGFSFIMFKYTQISREAYGCWGRILNITLRNVSSDINVLDSNEEMYQVMSTTCFIQHREHTQGISNSQCQKGMSSNSTVKTKLPSGENSMLSTMSDILRGCKGCKAGDVTLLNKAKNVL